MLCFMVCSEKEPIRAVAAGQGVSEGDEDFGFSHLNFDAMMDSG